MGGKDLSGPRVPDLASSDGCGTVGHKWCPLSHAGENERFPDTWGTYKVEASFTKENYRRNEKMR